MKILFSSNGCQIKQFHSLIPTLKIADLNVTYTLKFQSSQFTSSVIENIELTKILTKICTCMHIFSKMFTSHCETQSLCANFKTRL